jgi:hypothetical protein
MRRRAELAAARLGQVRQTQKDTYAHDVAHRCVPGMNVHT